MQELPQNVRVLRFFAADEARRAQALAQLPAGKLTCQQRQKGSETLVLLQSKLDSESANRSLLDSCQAQVAQACGADLYGADGQTLPQAAVAALAGADKLFVAVDEATGQLLADRLPQQEAGAVFDFGGQSYAHPRFGAKLAAAGAAQGDALTAARLRLQTAYRLTGADYVVACVPQAGGAALLVGNKKGCWQHSVSGGESAALWLLDMLRRAALGAPQAAGTAWGGYTAPAQPAAQPAQQPAQPHPQPQADARPPRPARRGVGAVLLALAVVALLALAAVAVAWVLTGGRLSALWDGTRLYPFHTSGASLL